ncbi:MAG: thiolase domain-containing protein [Actinomycetia bacterium]|nr:thiolase domain-containing protein [Actinomycetes bacterium]
MTPAVFILGGYQTDFARKWSREGLGIADIITEAAQGALADADVTADQIEVGHVGNFIGELLTGQGHLGGILVEADKAFAGMPVARHEAACASGSMAIMAAMADIESGRYDVALVVGAEEMRSRSGFDVAQMLGSAAWVPRETAGVQFPWPQLFSELAQEYDARYGLDPAYLAALAESNFTNARSNAHAHARDWEMPKNVFGRDDPGNPAVSGWIRKQDCSQVSDGGAAVVLASPAFTERWATAHAKRLADIPRITGWGHTSARMTLRDKLADAKDKELVFPHVQQAMQQALGRANSKDVFDLDLVELHDCFTSTHYMAIDHLGITEPGQSYQAIEDGTVLAGGRLPLNPSGGLMGGGHPVGATGVRMLVDASKQVSGQAGQTQVESARRAGTLNIGGSATTVAAFVVEA